MMMMLTHERLHSQLLLVIKQTLEAPFVGLDFHVIKLRSLKILFLLQYKTTEKNLRLESKLLPY
jgi:hypothetical protein